MDFGNKVGAYSKIGEYDKQTKVKKLKKAKILLEWLASKDSQELYATSAPIKGFQKIRFKELQRLVKQ
jgi:uncharacterized Rossmann fold enzyme